MCLADKRHRPDLFDSISFFSISLVRDFAAFSSGVELLQQLIEFRWPDRHVLGAWLQKNDYGQGELCANRRQDSRKYNLKTETAGSKQEHTGKRAQRTKSTIFSFSPFSHCNAIIRCPQRQRILYFRRYTNKKQRSYGPLHENGQLKVDKEVAKSREVRTNQQAVSK